MKNKVLFNDRQIFYFSIIPALLCFVMLTVFYVLEIGEGAKKVTLVPYLFGISVFLFVVLISYSLNIKIDNQFLYITFGLGLIHKKIAIESIEVQKEFVNVRWYYGVGLRFSNFGTIYNVKTGEGIRLKLKNKKKFYIIVSDRNIEIKETLLCIQNNKK
jgi:hypothetical protein